MNRSDEEEPADVLFGPWVLLVSCYSPQCRLGLGSPRKNNIPKNTRHTDESAQPLSLTRPPLPAATIFLNICGCNLRAQGQLKSEESQLNKRERERGRS